MKYLQSQRKTFWPPKRRGLSFVEPGGYPMIARRFVCDGYKAHEAPTWAEPPQMAQSAAGHGKNGISDDFGSGELCRVVVSLPRIVSFAPVKLRSLVSCRSFATVAATFPGGCPSPLGDHGVRLLSLLSSQLNYLISHFPHAVKALSQLTWWLW